MKHMWLCCLAICQFAIFPQAHFEPVEQFQPIWQKAKGLRHTNFCLFHQKLQLREEKDPACCCQRVAGRAAGTSDARPPTQGTGRGYEREAAELGEDTELSSAYLQTHQRPCVLPQPGFASTNRILLQRHLQASAENQAIFTGGYFVPLGLFMSWFFFFSK